MLNIMNFILVSKKKNKGDEQKKVHEPTTNELSQLLDISEKYKNIFNAPVPLSYNKTKADVSENSYQRYLNVRFECGFDDAHKKVNQIKDEINNTIINDVEKLNVLKIISEYVWYDTYRQLDAGWIDF